MARNDPFRELERVFEQLSQGFEEFDPASGFGRDAAVDLADTGESFEVVVDLPGFDSDDIGVTLPDATTVRITARRETATEREEQHFVRRERRQQSVDRTVSLPERVDESETTASYDDGVLTVTLPRLDESDATDIPVN